MEISKRFFINEIKTIMAILGTNVLNCFSPFSLEVYYSGIQEIEDFFGIEKEPSSNEIYIRYKRFNEDGELIESGKDAIWTFSQHELNQIRELFFQNLDEEEKKKIEAFLDSLA